MQDGILIINKPADMTSQDVVYKLKRAYNIKKVGHTGTLDPMVEGVMVVCFGKATKLAQFLLDEDKKYRVQAIIGLATDTEDLTGETIQQTAITIEMLQQIEQTLATVLLQFVGDYEQIPPMYSAVKINGKKLYEYARKNIEVERSARTVEVKELVLDSQSITMRAEQLVEYEFIVHSSKGLYVRTLCVDIAKQFNLPGTMKKLVRIASGQYTLNEAIDLQVALETLPELIGLDTIKLPLKRVEVATDVADKLKVGYKLPKYFVTENITEMFAVYDEQTKELIGIFQPSQKYEDKYESIRIM